MTNPVTWFLDGFRSRPFSVTSPLTPDVALERLREKLSNPMVAEWESQRRSGGVHGDKVVIHGNQRLLQNPFSRRFRGTIQRTGAGSELAGKIGITMLVPIFLGIWVLGMTGLSGYIAAAGGIAGMRDPVFVATFLIGFALVLSIIGVALGKGDDERIRTFAEDQLGAVGESAG